MSRIKSVHARQLIDCKCRPMVEVDIVTDDGFRGTGSAPTGSSVGMYESCVLRDGDEKEFKGMGVRKAVTNVNEIIAPALLGMDVTDQEAIDRKMIELDGTPDKRKLGGNAIYSVSIAAVRAAAASKHMEVYRMLCGREIKTVPVPSFNVMNGGNNNGVKQAFNEFLIVPYKAETITEAVDWSCQVYQQLRSTLREYLGSEPLIGGSYGYAAPGEDPDLVLSLMQKAIDDCGFTGKFCFALDCASSEMYDKETGTYYLNGKRVTSAELVAYTKKLAEKYPFLFIEDLLDENDWEGFSLAVREITNTIIIGDDLIVTNIGRLKKAYEEKAVQGFILKPNQVGTLTEAFETYRYAKEHGMYAIPSGRSGGVVGDIVMDLSVGFEIPFQKNGAPKSGERIDKLNFLMRAAECAPDCRLSDLSGVVKF